MKRKKLIAIIVAALAVLALGVVVFFLATKGSVEEKDGLLQNSRIYLKDVRVEDRTIYYTVVNESSREIVIGAEPYVQKKVDGHWRVIALREDREDLAWILERFYEGEHRYTISYPQNLTQGEYRVVFGSFSVTENGLEPYGEGIYIVGNFTVTE